jgi:hypothetical protein
MHRDTLENWRKIKVSFEESGNTDNFFYLRACAIVKGESDPMEDFLNDVPNE